MKTLSKIVLIALFLSCLVPAVSAENYIGIILDGYQRDCVVQSRGEDYDCKECRQLYAGDKIIKKPDIKALKIKWAPYARGKQLDTRSLVVVFEPPKDKKGILQGIKEILGLVKTGHSVSVGATRGRSSELRVPQPGNNATIISGQNITFAWESGSGKYIVFKDSKGTEVFKKELKGESFIQLPAEEITMKPAEIYTWNISGARNNKQFKIRLLSDEIAQQVTADLKEIEKKGISSAEKEIRKAAYLQFMSDAYPQDIDLYWLSYSLLEGIKDESISKKDDKVLLDELKKNYVRHVRETM